jgi:hypothetical protein
MKTFMITKPMVPWDDSAKNMARDIVFGVPGRKFHCCRFRTTASAPKTHARAFYFDVQSGISRSVMKMRIFARIIRRTKSTWCICFFSRTAYVRMRLSLALKAHKCMTPYMRTGNFENPLRCSFADRIVLSANGRRRLEDSA